MRLAFFVPCLMLVVLTGCPLPNGKSGSSPPGDTGTAKWLVDPQTGQKYALDVNRNRPFRPDMPGIGSNVFALTIEGADGSGRLHLEVVDCFNGEPEQHPSVACSVDPSFVVVGGGARTYYYGPGALLTETRPFDGQLGMWVASSKDHGQPDRHYLQVFAVGMRLDGVSRSDLLAQMQLKSATSGVTAHPQGEVSTDEGFTMIGGGGKVNWTGEGNLLTRSSPAGELIENRSWEVEAKDHLESSPASVTAYVIGIRPNIPGFGQLEFATRFMSTLVPAYVVGDLTKPADGGWVSACPGALAEWQGVGRLLFGIVPTITTGQALDKDHLQPADGELFAYVRQIRVKP